MGSDLCVKLTPTTTVKSNMRNSPPGLFAILGSGRRCWRRGPKSRSGGISGSDGDPMYIDLLLHGIRWQRRYVRMQQQDSAAIMLAASSSSFQVITVTLPVCVVLYTRCNPMRKACG